MKQFIFVACLICIVILFIACNSGLSGLIVVTTPSEGEIQACKGMLGSEIASWQFTWYEKALGKSCYTYQQMAVSGAGN